MEKEYLPIGNNVFVEVDEMKKKVGLIELPEVHSERSRVGTVRAAGPECEHVREGDRVLVWWADGKHLHDIESYVLDDLKRFIKEDEILAIVKEE